jgi:ABC-2 type transport system ATP-binding protein
LLKKQHGTISFFGMPFQQNRIAILRKVGSFIESPSLYGHLTATENLMLLQKIYQCPKSRIGEVLGLVGLSHTGLKKVSQFSLGMKQRLSIAVALLHHPALLILDEPTNGLDPTGIIEMRELLKTLNREQGITILISSHLLAEIEKLVTNVGIIHHGKMMFQGTLEALKGMQQQSSYVTFDTNNPVETSDILQRNNLPFTLKDGLVTIPLVSKKVIAAINQHIVNSGIEVYEISIIKKNLETIFMDLITN